MQTIYESLTDQVDGLTDTFTTFNQIGSIDQFFVVYNGQVVNEGDVAILSSTSFQLSFVPQVSPAIKDTLSVVLTDIYCISYQIDGITNTFTKAVSDTGNEQFIAILNGQFLFDQTKTLNSSTFQLIGIVPQIGDTLCYVRSNNFQPDVPDFILPIKSKIDNISTVNSRVLNKTNVYSKIYSNTSINSKIFSVSEVKSKIKNVSQVKSIVELSE